MKPEKYSCRFSGSKFRECTKFAVDVLTKTTSQTKYSGRAQDKFDLLKKQSIEGKLGEEAAYNAYSQYYPNLSKPDYQIYDVQDKSFKEDLIDPVSGIKISVKTKDHLMAEKYGPSWVFSVDDDVSFAKNPDPNQYVCCVVVDRFELRAAILACVKLTWLHDNKLFEQPDRPSSTRLAVRYSSMKRVVSSNDELWQLGV